MSSDNDDVRAFHDKFGLVTPDTPHFLDDQAFTFRSKFLSEEHREFVLAHASKDMKGAADALVDLVYVAHGTALMMGIPWQAVWDEVQRRNMQKVRAEYAFESKRKSTLDIIKPTGWQAPDHTMALGSGPWLTHKHR